jgi:hypothetical protein
MSPSRVMDAESWIPYREYRTGDSGLSQSVLGQQRLAISSNHAFNRVVLLRTDYGREAIRNIRSMPRA